MMEALVILASLNLVLSWAAIGLLVAWKLDRKKD